MTIMQSFPGRVVPLQQCPSYDVLGDDFRVLLSGHDTQSDLALLHAHVHPNSTSPRHVHKTFEELYYLLQGELQITIGSHSERIQSGTLVYVPRNTVHSYSNHSHRSAQLLIWASPAGIEQLIIELSTAIKATASEADENHNLILEHRIRSITSQHDFIPVD